MKAKISISVLLMILLTTLMTAMSQEKTDEKKEQTAIIIESRKDAQLDLQKALQESLEMEEKALQKKMELGKLDNKTYLFETERAIHDYKRQLEQMKTKNQYIEGDNYVTAPTMSYRFGGNFNNPMTGVYSGERENTSLSISKTLEDVTISTDFYYDVKEGSSRVSFYVSGTLKSGELKITLKQPDKTTFQEITISPLADVNWNQLFSWDEDEADEYIGKWIISISANKAAGNYRVQVNSR
jgi:hypothetical protein